jgi:hypothetical protein
MKGLIFNILSELSERAGCQDDAWEVALAGAAMGDDEYLLVDELPATGGAHAESEDEDGLDLSPDDDDDDELDVEIFDMPYLEGEWGDSFRFLVRSAAPFSDHDWQHLPGTPVRLGGKPERGDRRSEPGSERTSFLPDADSSDPYAILMRSLAGAKR